jgi:hypothetical protein
LFVFTYLVDTEINEGGTMVMFQPTQCVNQIEGVCQDIERTINHTVQNTLNLLEKDCETLTVLVQKRLEQDRVDRGFNFKMWNRGKNNHNIWFFHLNYFSCVLCIG